MDRLEAAGAGLKEGPRQTPGPSRTAVSADRFLQDSRLAEEIFGPGVLGVEAVDRAELIAICEGLEGQLTATLMSGEGDEDLLLELPPILEERAGRILFGGFPTGAEFCAAMQHGGPWPASMDSRSSSAGTAVIERFFRPVSCQSAPELV
ncbi:MAG: hypothetical protein V3W41_18140 [Planctomycetota bacterium]